ncbi:MAG: hypothetical protein Ct9H300mP16_15720 [Pseudomonadota bacterium]|nr:MAG: hypothetical protein Ct9H300mP16_15720 [Pseudomonadota bacterium]
MQTILGSAVVGYFQGGSRQLKEGRVFPFAWPTPGITVLPGLAYAAEDGLCGVRRFYAVEAGSGLVFLVQSPDRTPDEIEAAIEDFLRGFSRTLAAILATFSSSTVRAS